MLEAQNEPVSWTCGRFVFQWPQPAIGRPQCHPIVMGILNVTPDSFSDGGKFYNHKSRH
jgi:dihydropteroate synthase